NALLVANGSSVPADLKDLAASGLADQIEMIKITPNFLSTEETFKLWMAFQAPYRPTTGDHVSVVLIDTQRQGRGALPLPARRASRPPLARPGPPPRRGRRGPHPRPPPPPPPPAVPEGPADPGRLPPGAGRQEPARRRYPGADRRHGGPARPGAGGRAARRVHP